MALGATTEYYDATEIATQILPHLVALTVDSDSDVRMKAFQATEVFLKTDHLKLNAGDSVVPPTTVTGSTTTGLLGCSVNSLASKHQFGDLVSPLSESSSISNNTASVMEVPAASSIVTLSYSSRFTEEVSAASPTLTDGWGDAQDNGFAHNNDDNDEKDGCGDMDLQPKLEPALTHI